jgi:hypothetical protein
MSKAFLMSKNSATIDKLLLKFKSDLIHQHHRLKCNAVTCSEAKLTCIQYVSFLSVFLDCSQNHILEMFAFGGQEAEVLGPCKVSAVMTFAKCKS